MKRGFTLIELSIVLVIIGLIASGIMAGKELVYVAKIRRTITQVEQTQTAINVFKNKYNCLPGDCAKATDYWPDTIDGDGNDRIDLGFDVPEPINMWHQMSLAKLVAVGKPGSFDNMDDYIATIAPGMTGLSPDHAPRTPLDNYLLVEYTTVYSNSIAMDRHWMSFYRFPNFEIAGASVLLNLSHCIPENNDNICFGLFPADAGAIDLKMDDGNPTNGIVRGISDVYGCGSGSGVNAIYEQTRQLHKCHLMIDLKF
jgi:prepilin-type N-terminal cleavage/methylation domain-containing protein